MPAGRVVVVGGGISGLAAAWELTGGAQRRDDAPRLTVLEAGARLGGALRSDTFGGRPVDMGPDGFLGRRPEAVELCHEVGLGDALVPIGARGASVWARGRLRALPDKLALGIPTEFWPTARSGVLGLAGQLGLARDALLPRPDLRGPMGDRSIGPLVARKLGRRVVDALVDPLIGGIHAGSVDDMSAAAVFPPLLAAAQRRGGLMRALRAEVPASPEPDDAPLFWTLRDGMGSLVASLAAGLHARGVDVRLSAPVDTLARVDGGWDVAVGADVHRADGVVLAVPGDAASRLLQPHDDEAAGLLEAIDYAAVTIVTFRVAADDAPTDLYGTGFLVPRRSAHPGREPWSVTACTFLDRKWPQLARHGEVLLRASLGRIDDTRPAGLDDEEVTNRAWEELGALLGVGGRPLESTVVRWPAALPQYRVHHLLRTAGIDAAVARLGNLAVAGAAYRGVGIPACVASGRAAAHALL